MLHNMWKIFGKSTVNNNNAKRGVDDTHLIDLRDIKKVYKTEAGDFMALKGINLSIDRGEFVDAGQRFHAINRAVWR